MHATAANRETTLVAIKAELIFGIQDEQAKAELMGPMPEDAKEATGQGEAELFAKTE
jgi:hypothetical protein